MSVKIKIPSGDVATQEKLKFKIGQAPEPKKPQAKMKLKARRTINNNIIISDHPHVDIIIQPGDHKVITLPREVLNDEVFETQHELFRYLFKKGVLIFDSLQGGNIYGALEAKYPEESTIGDPLQLVMFSIAKFMESERDWFEYVDDYFEDQSERLLDPDAENSTELGEVPHEETKGSMRYVYNPYGVAYRLHEIKNLVQEKLEKTEYGLLKKPENVKDRLKKLVEKQISLKGKKTFLLAKPE